ncbi:MAG TPA: alpha-1,4-glucan--maltose-1-phosphate maltosyltransferase [Elusimicrobia bacterium]|nr:alpha-1,4-glucan--maltose-1-phosphate maltosyltransferase [Elusimicrobiota bacterium]
MRKRKASADWGRVAIEAVAPELDGGRFPVKRVVGETVQVEADIFADGHDALAARLLHRPPGSKDWAEAPMRFYDNDRWRGEFMTEGIGVHVFTLEAWVDRFSSWKRDLVKRLEAGQEASAELLAGADLAAEAAQAAGAGVEAAGKPFSAPAAPEAPIALSGAESLEACARLLRQTPAPQAAVETVLSPEIAALMARFAPRGRVTRYEKDLEVVVDRERARFSAWYEFFPRSCAQEPRHAAFKDCEKRLEYAASMGFDVVYLPPIHPIGLSHRKGRNNSTTCRPGDPGSPWAIGSEQGGHLAVHPELGTLEDFQAFRRKAEKLGLELALDIAFQCSPDHPYAKEHPEWFRRRPDGSIRYAENPPKKYEDIYPFDMEGEAWEPLWEELKNVFLYWAEQGVRIFRVDNPHTKPFAFWERAIRDVKKVYPDVLFLAEAFTRPKVMYRLAKLGFSQSYTYFAWRSTKWELTEYLTELTQGPAKEFFRPNFWPNTPDILTSVHVEGGRPAFQSRFILAAALGASYGIYGPAFELCVNRPRQQGSEEYLDSEKYEIKRWDLGEPQSLRLLIAKVNRIRRENPALQSNRGLHFHPTDNERLLCFSKRSEGLGNVILAVVNLDWRWAQSGWVDVPVASLGLDPMKPYQVRDLLSDARYTWNGSRNFVKLDPAVLPAHLFRVEQAA